MVALLKVRSVSSKSSDCSLSVMVNVAVCVPFRVSWSEVIETTVGSVVSRTTADVSPKLNPVGRSV